MKRPLPPEYPDYFKKYIDQVKGENVLKVLESQILDMQFILSDIPEEKENYTYEKGKWTLKEVIGHVIDTERIMAYRALCFARGTDKPQPGYDPDVFMKNVDFNKRTLYNIAHEFGVVRESNLILFKSFSEGDLDKTGTANDWDMSVRALIWVIAGHAIHHLNVIKTKYLD